MLIVAAKPAVRASRMTRLGKLGGMIAGVALFLSQSAWSAMSTDEALDIVRAMVYTEAPYEDIVLTLVGDGRTLPEATTIAMQAITPFQERTQLARTALCMCQDIAEAEMVTSAAIAAVPPGDPVINAIVTEFAMYQRSSCLGLNIETTEPPPLETSSGRLDPDVSPSF
jgi:hypothetical protein